MKRISLLLFPCYLLLIAGNLYPQVRVQVVSREISKQVEWTEGMSLVINGDNAEITCSAHPAATIDIDLTIVSKHQDISNAEEDLEKMKVLVEVKDNKCYIRNYIELNRNQERPESAIKVICRVMVPENCPVDVKNYFGRTDITSLNSNLTVCSEYGPVNLSDLSGSATVSSVFGDITTDGFLRKASITSSHSLINFRLDNPDQYNYYLELSGTEIIKPDNMTILFTKNEKGKITGNISGKTDSPLISLILTSCRLTIQQNKH